MPAKQLEFNVEARARLKRGVDQLAEAEKGTLGPKGREGVIDKKVGKSTVTKDRVTGPKESEVQEPDEKMGAPNGKERASQETEIPGYGRTASSRSKRPRASRPRSRRSRACSSIVVTSRPTSSLIPKRWRRCWRTRTS